MTSSPKFRIWLAAAAALLCSLQMADAADKIQASCGQRLKALAGTKDANQEEVERLLDQQQEAIATYTVATEAIDKITLRKGDEDGTAKQRPSAESRAG